MSEEIDKQRRAHAMALVSVTNVLVLDNPTAFANPFAFEITFECIQVGRAREREARGSPVRRWIRS